MYSSKSYTNWKFECKTFPCLENTVNIRSHTSPSVAWGNFSTFWQIPFGKNSLLGVQTWHKCLRNAVGIIELDLCVLKNSWKKLELQNLTATAALHVHVRVNKNGYRILLCLNENLPFNFFSKLNLWIITRLTFSVP